MKILVAEDEHRVANAVKQGLEQEHYIVDVAYSGDLALDLALNESYDAIILDLMLPQLDGITICKEIRKSNNPVPILMLTAKSELLDKVTGLDTGADDYLTKPFAFDELLARVRALLRRPVQLISDTLEVADLSMDTTNHQVTRADQSIALTSKEFTLLEYLMRYPDQVFSKDKIIAHVWDYDADVLPNTVEVMIKNLRKKIDQPFPNLPSLIQTVRGYGYKIGS
jgi:two-component system, OmpR family, response regulator